MEPGEWKAEIYVPRNLVEAFQATSKKYGAQLLELPMSEHAEEISRGWQKFEITTDSALALFNAGKEFGSLLSQL